MNTTPRQSDPFARARARVPGFCQRHFSLRGSLALHRAAVGWDMIRAPVNVILALVLLAVRLAGLMCRVLRFQRAARWCQTRRVLLPTELGRQIETLIRSEVLRDPKGDASANLLADYAGTRTAAADITTSIGALSTGAIAFKTVTPGVVSLAPFMALTFAQSAAIAAFPLGGAMGSAWYWMFPAQASWWMMVLFALGLAVGASVFTTFAGVLADPVQLAMGLHQRRLRRLIDRLEVNTVGSGAPDTKGFGTGEHILARLGDLIDIVLSLVRNLRP